MNSTGTPSQRPAMVIQNRRIGLPERGKIKIGMRGQVRKSAKGSDYQPPEKLDHFIVTTTERGPDGNFVPDDKLMAEIGALTGQPSSHLTEIPVRLLWNDIDLNFSSRYAAYNGHALFCAGNGVEANRTGIGPIACPCERIEAGYTGPQPCKINGILSVLIDGASGVGGVWKFRTTAFNSVDSLTGSLTFLKSITGGQLAGLPLLLTVRPKQVTRQDGKQNTIYMVGIEYQGTVEDLRAAGYDIAYKNAEAKLSLERAEAEARKLLEAPENGVLPGDDPEDVVAEFYPSQAQKAAEAEAESDPPQPEDNPEHEVQAPLNPLDAIHGAESKDALEAIYKVEYARKASRSPKDYAAIMGAIRQRKAELDRATGGPSSAPTSMPGKRGATSEAFRALWAGVQDAHFGQHENQASYPAAYIAEAREEIAKLHEQEAAAIYHEHQRLTQKATP
jgi:Recombination directionality factor-like